VERAIGELLEESRAALALLERMLVPLELIGGGGEIRPLCDQLKERLQRDEVVVELTGLRRVEAIESLLGAPLLPRELAPGLSLRLRAAAELRYFVRWPDGRTEASPADPVPRLTAELGELERRIVQDTDEANRLASRLQEAARNATHERAELGKAEHARTTPFPKAPAPPAPPPARPGRLRALFARLWALLTGLFRRRPALPPAEAKAPPGSGPEIDLEARSRRVALAEEQVAQTEASLAAIKQALTARSTEREHRRHELEGAGEQHRRKLIARLAELSGTGAGSFEIELEAPSAPAGVVLLLRGPAPTREEADAKLAVDGGDNLRERLAEVCARRVPEIARRITAALCDGRNQVIDVERRARQAHEQRIEELTARRVISPDRLRRETRAGAARTAARRANEIVDEAAGRLESLLTEVRNDWEQRIGSCAGLEQLRAEIAAIEAGATHRLSIVCDELREAMTLQFVRLVLELSRTLRQELLDKRLEVAHGSPAKLAESFEGVRVTLPATLEAAFQPLRARSLGELMSTERGLLDSLLPMLNREKRSCLAKLGARLDEIQHSTTRELYAAAVFISPLVLNNFAKLVDELVGAHQSWIEELVANEERSFRALRMSQEPAIALLPALEEQEAKLGARLEALR
jgi:hypothetical protein